jgi:hypothetical protein
LSEKSLKSSEWIIICSFFLIFSSLAFFAHIKAHRVSVLLSTTPIPSEKLIPVTFRGAVSKPGVYLVAPGTPLGEIIKKCRPKKNAHLELLNLMQTIEQPLELEIAVTPRVEKGIE